MERTNVAEAELGGRATGGKGLEGAAIETDCTENRGGSRLTALMLDFVSLGEDDEL
jgi:hypothetical protein